MARGAPWTEAEDEMIRAAHAELVDRMKRFDGDWNRAGQGVYQQLSLTTNRTVAAIRQRAMRLGLKAYGSWKRDAE